MGENITDQSEQSDDQKEKPDQRHVPKPKASVVRKQKLVELLSDHNERDLRIMYFEAPKNYIITAVTKLMREDGYIIASFAFCSPKDSFCKADGKIKCLERIRDYNRLTSEDVSKDDTLDCSYIITMPFANMPAIINVGFAYNLLPNKPLRLLDSRFVFDTYGDIIIPKEECCVKGGCACKSTLLPIEGADDQDDEFPIGDQQTDEVLPDEAQDAE
jgi:hypothetical protein